MMKWLAGFQAFAYKSLILFFLILAVLAYANHIGSWFNYFVVFLALSCPLVLVWLPRHPRKSGRRQAASTEK